MRTTAVMAGGACAALLGGLLVLAGCAGAKEEAADKEVLAATLPAGLQPQASILDLMLEFIDPNADEMWESVAIVSTSTGVEEHHPRTDAEWKAVRRKALTVMESANLLVIEGRPVAHPGQELEEPGGEGDYTPAQAQVQIDGDRRSFVAFAGLLQAAAGEMLKAIDQRDPDAFLEAGGVLDEACEKCHRRFWYPNSPLPPGL
jgi:cytochrome c556